MSEERILYHLPLSAGSRAVRLALAEKGWDCALVAEPVWERRESFLVLNPAGEVPVLADGATAVCGAGPILEYLDDVQPDSPLIAGGPAQRAECRRLCDWFARAFHGEVVHPLLDEKVLKRFFRRGQPDSETIRLAKTALTAHLDYIAWLVERRRWLAGTPHGQVDVVPVEADEACLCSYRLLVMPGWLDRRFIGVKVVSVVPGNEARGLATVMGSYLMLEGRSGRPIALMDGPVLTRRRTAATSALAAKYLARPDSERLLMVGTGAMAPYLIEAHASVRPIASVLVWGRNEAKAKRLARRMNRSDLRVEATGDLEGAVRGADIVTCATLSQAPLVQGGWLTGGTHLDLVGGFTPAMRETDDDAMRRGRLFVDDRDSAISEAGDVLQPIADGVITADDVAGDLGDLVRGLRDGRRYYDQVTIFKSVGTAIADLAAGYQALERT